MLPISHYSSLQLIYTLQGISSLFVCHNLPHSFSLVASCSTAAKDQTTISPFPQNSFATLVNAFPMLLLLLFLSSCCCSCYCCRVVVAVAVVVVVAAVGLTDLLERHAEVV